MLAAEASARAYSFLGGRWQRGRGRGRRHTSVHGFFVCLFFGGFRWTACEIGNRTSVVVFVLLMVVVVVVVSVVAMGGGDQLWTSRGIRSRLPAQSRVQTSVSVFPSFPRSLPFRSLQLVLKYLRRVIRHRFPIPNPVGRVGRRREEKYLTESYTKRGHSEFLTFFAHGRFK